MPGADSATQIALVLEDFKAAYRLLKTGGLAAYSGKFAAFFNGQLVGVGLDSVDLRKSVGQEQSVPPDRIAVIHVFDEAVV